MYIQNRKIIALLTLCLAFIGCVAALKMNDEYVSNSSNTTIETIPITGTTTSVDSSFFNQIGSTIQDLFSTTSNNVVRNQTVVEKPVGPTISAEAYIAANVISGKIYFSKDDKQPLPVASMSKLITAFAATDIFTSTTTITITEDEATAPPDASGIRAGEKYTLGEILYPMLLDSSNIAAEAIASSTDREKFLGLMSSYAWEVGMPTAYFADPSGVNPHNVASAQDLFALAKYLYKYRPDILAITRTASTSIATTTDHGSHDFVSIHPFVNTPGFIGGKTGRTPEAGDTMMTIMNIGGQPIAFIVLGSRYDGRADDTQMLIDMVKKLPVR